MAHITGLAAFFIIVIFLAVAGTAAWIIYTHFRARRLGLPTPSLASYNPFSRGDQSYGAPRPARGGVSGWFSDKLGAFKNRNNRSAGGAYEEPLSSNVRGRASNRGFGPLDPDEAWDTRVGTEADAYGPGGYYEEQELGLHHELDSHMAPTPGLAPPGYGDGSRGRSLTRDAEPYEGRSQGEHHGKYNEDLGEHRTENPFDDAAEPSNVSLRGVSPRPIETSQQPKRHRSNGSADSNSPNERRSMFRENI